MPEQIPMRELFEELRSRAQAIGGELNKTFCFNEEGEIAGTEPAKAYYRRPYWLAREATCLTTGTLTVTLPEQFGQLERAIARNEQLYLQQVRTLHYGHELPAVELMGLSVFEQRLKELARRAGGDVVVKCYEGKTYAYYYRYTRLKTATVFYSPLRHQPHHSPGRHRYTFWLPIDYVLLRQMLEQDALLYAQLPPDMQRVGFPPSKSEPVVLDFLPKSEVDAGNSREALGVANASNGPSRAAQLTAAVMSGRSGHAATGLAEVPAPIEPDDEFVKREWHYGTC